MIKALWQLVFITKIKSHKSLKKILITTTLNTPHQAVLSIAESIVQSSLRSLDAIQVASVIFLSPKNNTLITYDKNMAKEARLLGIKVESPGQ